MQHWKSAHRRILLRPILADGGSPPLRGNCCFTVRYLSTQAITTDLTLRPPLFTLRPPLSHTPLSHTTLTHDALTHHSQTHCSHTMTISTAVSRRNGTKALPPARLPGAWNLEPTQSQLAPWQQGGWAQAHHQGCREGGGAAKKTTDECGVQGKEGRAHSSGPPSNMTLQGYWFTVEPYNINCFRNHHH